MASFKKMPNGKYQGSVYLGRGENGKVLRKYFTCRTLHECKRHANEIEKLLYEGKYTSIYDMTASTWFDQWLELNEYRLGPNTYVSYKGYVEKHYKPHLGKKYLSKIEKADVQRLMNDLMKNLSNNTVRKMLYVLGEILEDKLKGRNPVKDLKFPEKNKTRERILTDEEVSKILDVVKQNPQEELITLLACHNGLRRGEIFALQPGDIRAREGYIQISKARTKSKNGYVIDKTKSDNGNRIVETPPQLMDKLERYRSMKNSTSDLLFEQRPDAWTKRFARIVKEAGLVDVTFHDLRHYHATWLYNNQMPDHMAARRLGHDVFTLKSIYQHISDDEMKKQSHAIITKIEESRTLYRIS